MNTPFFITGLPRSRTAWLANLLTHGRSFCLHDGTLRGLPELIATMKTLGDSHAVVGDADSGLLFYVEELKQLFPKARWVFVKREPVAAQMSYKRHFNGRDPYLLPGTDLVPLFRKLADQYAQARNMVHHLEVPFERLDDVETVKAVWDWCLPHDPFDAVRAEQLLRLRVNIIPERVRR